MQEYKYDGPVMRFDDCIQHRWKTAICRIAKSLCPVN